MQALQHEQDGAVRAEIIKGLVMLSGKGTNVDEKVVRAILPFLEDKVSAVRVAAQTALGIASVSESETVPSQHAPKGAFLWGPIPGDASREVPQVASPAPSAREAREQVAKTSHAASASPSADGACSSASERKSGASRGGKSAAREHGLGGAQGRVRAVDFAAGIPDWIARVVDAAREADERENPAPPRAAAGSSSSDDEHALKQVRPHGSISSDRRDGLRQGEML